MPRYLRKKKPINPPPLSPVNHLCTNQHTLTDCKTATTTTTITITSNNRRKKSQKYRKTVVLLTTATTTTNSNKQQQQSAIITFTSPSCSEQHCKKLEEGKKTTDKHIYLHVKTYPVICVSPATTKQNKKTASQQLIYRSHLV